MLGIPRRPDVFAEGEEHDPDSTRSAPAMAVTMYSTTWCGYCSRLKAQMGREGIEYVEVNIETDPEAAAFVESVNGGNQTVPTLLYPDGSAETNPSIAQVKAKLGL
jgi:mycoredoxin